MEFPATDNFVWIPVFQNAVHYFFHVIEIGLRLEGIVDAIVTGHKELVVVHLGGIVAEMRKTGGFDETVGHERAGGDDGLHDAALDEVAKYQSHFSDSECSGKSHNDETVFVARHGFENVCSITNLPGGVRGGTHCSHKFVDGSTFGKIKGEDGAQLVLDGIVQHTPSNCLLPFFRH